MGGLIWDNCPICGREMRDPRGKYAVYEVTYKECVNGCVSHLTSPLHDTIQFFREESRTYRVWLSDINKEQTISKINGEIAYWKKNDRYLIKILSR